MAAIFLSAGSGHQNHVKRVLRLSGRSGAPPAGAPAAAIATGAAAVTPHFSSSFFTKSAASITVNLLNSSTRFPMSAILPFFRLVVRRSPGGFQFTAREPTIYVVVLLFVQSTGQGGSEMVQLFSDLAWMTRASCDAGVLIKIASLVAGAFNKPSNVARKTSRLGKSASALIAASSSR